MVAPDLEASRENSIVAYNTRRLVTRVVGEPGIPVVVPVRGRDSRERRDFFEWLVANDYVPGIPRWVAGENTLLHRYRQLNEYRELVENFGEWVYAALDWDFKRAGREAEAADRIMSMPGQWELFE